MPEKKPICKICPKKKKAHKAADDEQVILMNDDDSDLFFSPEDEHEEEEGGEDEEEVPPCAPEQFREIATAGHVLDEVLPDSRQNKLSFFCTGALKTRYENMLPLDVTNDHQYNAALQKTILGHMSNLRITSEPFCARQPAIIATLGPSCFEVKEIEDLLDSGMNIARLNMAYGDRCCQLYAINNFKTAVKNYQARIGYKIPVGLLMDLKGCEIRTGKIYRLFACGNENPQLLIEKNTRVKVTTEVAYIDKMTPNLIYVDYPEFIECVRPGMKIYIDDGKLQLIVQTVKEKDLMAYVEEEGYLRNYRPVHVPMVPFPFPTISTVDAEDIELAIEEDFDFLAISKPQTAEIISTLKGKLVEGMLTAKKMREKPIMVLAKISNFLALNNIDEIIKVADGIIIHRGDLGLELPPEKVYVAQRAIIGKCNLANKPVICTAHLMPSMMNRRMPEYSNVLNIASCIEDGADAICLTQETAIGHFPCESLIQTHHILREAEAAEARKYHFQEMMQSMAPPLEPIVAIGMAACILASKLKSTAIIVATTSGKSAQIISSFRPRCTVLAVTSFQRTARQLHLWKSVCPLLYTGPHINYNWFENLDYRFQFGIAFGKERGFIKPGDPLILVSGYGKTTTFTNCLRVVYASTQPPVYQDNPKEFYDNIFIYKGCVKGKPTCGEKIQIIQK